MQHGAFMCVHSIPVLTQHLPDQLLVNNHNMMKEAECDVKL